MNLNALAISLPIVPADKCANFKAAEEQLRQMPEGTDVAILPELFSTGFIADKQEAFALSETNQGDTIAEIERMARTYNCAICGSFLAHSGPWLYNRAFFVEPSGDVTFYDKRHLFSLSTEPEIMKAGIDVPPVVRFRGWNIAIAVCYDLRFPTWLRNRDLRYDLLIIVANWPAKRQFAWHHLLVARAIENQAYVVGANYLEPNSEPMTEILDYTGKTVQSVLVLGASGAESAQAHSASLSMESLEKYRSAFPFYKDAD